MKCDHQEMISDKVNNTNEEAWPIPKFSNIFGPALFIGILLVSSYVFRDYIQSVLRWVESQPNPIVFLILVGLYILVSLPIAWGYIAINIATGYLYGLKVGLVVTVISATIGIIIAHYIMKTFLASYVESLISNPSGSLLKKLKMLLNSKKDAFQLVVLARLTPLPFGLQNSFFAISPLTISKYIQASCLGSLPFQVINVYLGSTLRSMEEVFTDPSTATVGVLVLFCQLTFIGIAVLFIIQKASYHLETIEKEHIEQDFDVVVIPTKTEKNQNNVG